MIGNRPGRDLQGGGRIDFDLPAFVSVVAKKGPAHAIINTVRDLALITWKALGGKV